MVACKISSHPWNTTSLIMAYGRVQWPLLRHSGVLLIDSGIHREWTSHLSTQLAVSVGGGLFIWWEPVCNSL